MSVLTRTQPTMISIPGQRIVAVGYDRVARLLYVGRVDGDMFVYEEVLPALYDDMLISKRPDTVHDQRIAGKHPRRRVTL
jgi:hypothetical protein